MWPAEDLALERKASQLPAKVQLSITLHSVHGASVVSVAVTESKLELLTPTAGKPTKLKADHVPCRVVAEDSTGVRGPHVRSLAVKERGPGTGLTDAPT